MFYLKFGQAMDVCVCVCVCVCVRQEPIYFKRMAGMVCKLLKDDMSTAEII
jgi:hypothetical protein